jgi:hypothetical protein
MSVWMKWPADAAALQVTFQFLTRDADLASDRNCGEFLPVDECPNRVNMQLQSLGDLLARIKLSQSAIWF